MPAHYEQVTLTHFIYHTKIQQLFFFTVSFLSSFLRTGRNSLPSFLPRDLSVQETATANNVQLMHALGELRQSFNGTRIFEKGVRKTWFGRLLSDVPWQIMPARRPVGTYYASLIQAKIIVVVTLRTPLRKLAASQCAELFVKGSLLQTGCKLLK